MEPWIPLLQTLVWPTLIGFVLCLYYSKVSAILDAIKIRITQGDDVSAGPSGFSLSVHETKAMALAEELIEAGKQDYRIVKLPNEQQKRIEDLSAQLERVTYLATHNSLQQQREIEEASAQLEYLTHLAAHDPLTDLYSRAEFNKVSESILQHAINQNTKLAFVIFDLDSFKEINDTRGHVFGDKVLVATAARLKQTIQKEKEVIARIGGDEFVAIFEYIDLNKLKSKLLNLVEAISAPLIIEEEAIRISASIGVSLYPQHGSTINELLRHSDEAMYSAKVQDRGKYVIFSESRVHDLHESLEHIRRALTAREFVLYYQPKVNMRTGTVIGAEALIRWQHPEKGLLTPDVFLPVINDYPLVVELGEWVIDTALTQIERWHAAGLNIPVSVNVDDRQLYKADFVERLRSLLAAHPNVKSGDLELEVLETSVVADFAKLSQVIDASRNIGVSFALDDFGASYSSLIYLKRLPVISMLKIYERIVRDMINGPDDLAIVEGVIGLATTFRLQVIAEGVETVEHGTMLLQLGCDLAQGYGIASPMSAHQLPDWAATWRPDPAWVNLPSVSRDDLPFSQPPPAGG